MTENKIRVARARQKTRGEQNEEKIYSPEFNDDLPKDATRASQNVRILQDLDQQRQNERSGGVLAEGGNDAGLRVCDGRRGRRGIRASVVEGGCFIENVVDRAVAGGPRTLGNNEWDLDRSANHNPANVPPSSCGPCRLPVCKS